MQDVHWGERGVFRPCRRMPISYRATIKIDGPAKLTALSAALEPADIILSRTQVPQGSAVCKYQMVFSPPYTTSACEFSHVVLYVGNDPVTHAQTQFNAAGGAAGVVNEPLGTVVMNKTICVLRWAKATSQQRLDIAAAVRMREGLPYAWGHIATAAWGAVKIKLNLRSARPTPQFLAYLASSRHYKRFVCSTLILDAYDEILKRANPLNVPGGLPGPIFVAADAYMNDELDTVVI